MSLCPSYRDRCISQSFFCMLSNYLFVIPNIMRTPKTKPMPQRMPFSKSNSMNYQQEHISNSSSRDIHHRCESEGHNHQADMASNSKLLICLLINNLESRTHAWDQPSQSADEERRRANSCSHSNSHDRDRQRVRSEEAPHMMGIRVNP